MINDLKDLKKFLQLCRSEGVESIRFGEVEVHLGPLPTKIAKSSQKAKASSLISDSALSPNGITEATEIPELIDSPDELTDEQLLFYSAQSQEPVAASN